MLNVTFSKISIKQFYCECNFFFFTDHFLKIEFQKFFFFSSPIPKLETICVNLYREADAKKKKDRSTLIGYVPIRIEELNTRHPTENWFV